MDDKMKTSSPGGAGKNASKAFSGSGIQLGPSLELLRDDVLAMLQGFPQGLDISSFLRTYKDHYGQQLLLSQYGLAGFQELTLALGDDVLVERIEGKNFIRIRDGVHLRKSPPSRHMDSTRQEVVKLVLEHPDGIPIKRLSVFYNKKYRRNLSLSVLGFPSMPTFLAFVEELVVENGKVFHRTHRMNSHPVVQHSPIPTPPASATPPTIGTLGNPLPAATTVLPAFGTVPNLPAFGIGPKPLLFTFGAPSNSLPPAFRSTPSPTLLTLANAPNLVLPAVGALSQEQLLPTFRTTPSPTLPTFGTSPNPLLPAPRTLTQDQLLQHVGQGRYPAAVTPEETQKASPNVWAASQSKVHRGDSPSPLRTSTLMDEALDETPNDSDSADFPPLAANSLTKAQRRRQQGQVKAAVKESVTSPSSSPAPKAESVSSQAKPEWERENLTTFHDAYHAQLRERHNANVRSSESLEALEGSTLRRLKKNNVTIGDANNLAADVIRSLATRGELVTVERVVCQVCEYLQIPSLPSAKINLRDLQSITNLQRTIKEVNMFIESMNAISAVCTLYELGQAMAGLQNKKRFEELHLGPLCKNPLIHKMFKVDANTKDEDIHRIETVDILRSLQAFRKKCKGIKVDLAEFMKHLADQYNCDSPYALGIRIQGLGLPISTLQKATATMFSFMDTAREQVRQELEQEVQEKLWKIKKTLMEPAEGAFITSSSAVSSRELRKKYAGMSAADAVMEVFTNAKEVFSAVQAKHVQAFLTRVKEDRLAKNLFQLAICYGSLDVPNDLPATGKSTANGGKKTAKTNSEEEDNASVMAPSETAVLQQLRERVTMLNGSPSLRYLCDLERKIADHFKVKAFPRLAQGSFLEFLVKQSEFLQEALGGTILIGNPGLGSAGSSTSGFQPSRQDVFEFIAQCGDGSNPDAIPFVEASLRSHYCLRDSRELGYGQLKTLMATVQRQKSLGDPMGPSPIRYETPLLPKSTTGELSGGMGTVGILGEVRRDQAVACLLAAPLLEDLCSWSLWELVFQPSLGPLKDFIHKHCANTNLVALEVRPGVLLRVTRATDDRVFADAVQSLDVIGATGHLVSLVVAYGIPNTPVALLANHVESSLAAALALQDPTGEEDGHAYDAVAQFALECMLRMPTRLCRALLQQIFLEPLSKVLGHSVSKMALLDRAKAEPRYLSKLHQMGVLLGITEWARDCHTKLLSGKMPEPASQQKKSVVVNGFGIGGSQGGLSDGEDSSEEHSVSSTSGDELSVSSEDGETAVNGKADDNGKLTSDLSSDDMSTSEDSQDNPSEPNPDQPEEAATESSSMSAAVEEVKEKAVKEEGMTTEEEAEVVDVSQQRAIVEDIRRSNFGVGVELTEEGHRLMHVHEERLGRSLQRLSTELYSKDTHFVLELIQNADDNSYELGGDVLPSLAFVIESNCITILNNESGFTEKNVRAICDVGRSTKGKHTYGYIGQKGIGFKSVFKVTDCPEVHSKDYHIRFDKNSGPMGYILPHWVQEERSLTVDHPEISNKSWTTQILLPLRPENRQTRNLFRDVHPSLLLFLHRLRSITIYDQTEGRIVSMSRQDLSHNILEVRHSHGLERWLVVKSLLQPKKIKEDVESTELAMAFCLNDTLSSSTSLDGIPAQPHQQSVFAFLPLRSFGFRFIIQGDFDIPSSREDVDRDSSWNQWLRSNLPQLFIEAMDVFQNHPEFIGLKGLCYYLRFVPLPDEIQDFFKPVASQILQLLKGRACLPAKEDRDGHVVFKQPSELAMCQDPVVQETVSAEALEQHLRLSYLHPMLQTHLPAALLATLGVRRLRGADIAAVTCAMARELMKGDTPLSDSQMTTLAKLLQCNYLAQEHEYGEAQGSLQGLKELPIIPLANGQCVALSNGGVFFPLGEDGAVQRGLEPLFRDLRTVSSFLLSCLDALGNSQVRELLRRLGVHELEPQQVLHQHIYPALSTNVWKSKPQDVIVSYLLFLKKHLRAQDYATLNAGHDHSDGVMSVPVLTNHGLLCPAHNAVHFSKDYSNMDLPTKLPGVDWVLVDSCYLRWDRDVVGWRELMGALGVRDLLIFKRERRTLTLQQLASSPWAEESRLWPKLRSSGPPGTGPGSGGEYVLEDWHSDEFRSLASTEELSPAIKQEQRKALLQLLDHNWDTGEKYSQYLRAQVFDSEGHQLHETRSSFAISLTGLPWIPSFRVQPGDRPDVVIYRCPGTVHLFSKELFSLLGAHVDYVHMEPSEFSRSIGMRHMVLVDEVIDFLKKWSSEASSDTSPSPIGEEEPIFHTTAQHIFSLYSYLQEQCPPGKLRELFLHTPAVFVESARSHGGEGIRNNWCYGKFYHLRDVCWNDPTGMFQRYKELLGNPSNGLQEPKMLAPFYSKTADLKKLFLGVGVERNPSMRQYVDLLEVVCESQSQATGLILQDVSILYAKLADKCTVPGLAGDLDAVVQLNPSYCSSLRDMLGGRRVFPSKRSCWVSLSQKPMIPDDKHLEKIFQAHTNVTLLNLPPAQKKPTPTHAHTRSRPGGSAAKFQRGEPLFDEDMRSLFLQDICLVPRLSDSVSKEAHTVSYRPSPALQALVGEALPYIQRLLCSHDDFTELYAELKEGGIATQIKSLTYGQVGELYIHYHMKMADGEELYEQENVVCLLKDRRELYIQKDFLNSKLDICRELVKLFTPDGPLSEKLATFLESLMGSLRDPAALKRFLDIKGVKELPEGEELWEIPMPVDTRPEPPMAPQRSISHQDSEQGPGPSSGSRGGDGLFCWPPQSGLADPIGSGSTAGGRTRSTEPAVEAALKMWPPPRAPSPSAEWVGTGAPAPSSSSGIASPRTTHAQTSAAAPGPCGEPLSPRTEAPPLASPSSQGPRGPPGIRFHSNKTGAQAQGQSADSPPEAPHPPESGGGDAGGGANGGPACGKSGNGNISGDPSEVRQKDNSSSTRSRASDEDEDEACSSANETREEDQEPGTSMIQESAATNTPELISSQFQGGGLMRRTPLCLDTAVWAHDHSGEAMLQDLPLDCPLPRSVAVEMGASGDLQDVGLWGERLVHSFLEHWCSHGPHGPTQVTWYNRNGETGHPCDFKLTFGTSDAESEVNLNRVVYVEVKTTTRQDRHLVRLSANELDFALKEKDRYHIYRVYGAGDAQSVRLCRIQNLAQHLHAKTLELFLFV